MTPRFSLTLSPEGIGLLHRTKTGWSEVGQVSLDDPDLGEALKMLRATASGLEGGGVLSELVLPEGQVLYSRLTPEGPLGEDSIRKALEGLTPYAVDELVFDWEPDGDGAQVAVVARETLAEAEAFAVEHRFNPVCFTARPTPEQFPRPPWFGPTAVAASLLPESETVEPAPCGGPTSAALAPEAEPEAESAETAPQSPEPQKPAPEQPLIAPLPAPEGRPAFATRRDPSSAPAAEAALQAVSAKARLTLAPGKPVSAPDIAGGAIGITAPEAPETAPSSPGRAKEKPAKKPRAKPARKPAKAPPPKAEAPKAPAPVTTPVAAPPPKAPGAEFALPGLFAPEPPSSRLRKLGLVLAAAALAALLLAALWALFLRDPGQAPQDNAAAPATVEKETALALPAPAQGPADPPAADGEQPPAEPGTLSAGQQDSAPAETGIGPAAPAPPAAPEQDRVDDVYIASLDPKVSAQDAIALPPAPEENHDARPATPANPPGPDDQFDLDARGLVRPTPEGTLNPEGVTVFSGPPRITPPERPETDAALDPAEAAEGEALTALRPGPRPDNLSEMNERANLGGLSRAELGARRPLPRAQSLQEEAMAEAEAEAAADGADDMGASALAVASSRKPMARPRDFSSAVEKAVQQARATAAAAPAAATAAPRIPSSASVAKQATLPDAINLHKVNLIGIYGSTSNRRALVRLKSGRYVKVQMGDRLDGGTVTAIGETELRYRKGNRDHVLELPQG